MSRIGVIGLLTVVLTIPCPSMGQSLPDLVVKEIAASRDPEDPLKVLVRFGVNDDGEFFEQWFDREQQRRGAEGFSAEPEDVYPFVFHVDVDGRRLEALSDLTHLSRNGNRVVVLPLSVLEDREPHTVEVHASPRYMVDRDLSNNSLERELRFFGKRVNIVVDRLRVDDDCDEVSDGDWQFLIVVSQTSGAGVPIRIWGAGTEPTDLATGFNRRPRSFVIPVERVMPGTPMRVHVEAIDCDMDGPLSLLYNPNPFAVPIAVATWVESCSGEEVWEASGTNDFVGSVDYFFFAEEARSGVVKSATSGVGSLDSPLRRPDCDLGAFTMDLHIEDPPTTSATPFRVIRMP